MKSTSLDTGIRYRLSIMLTTGTCLNVAAKRWSYGDGMLWYESLDNELECYYIPLHCISKVKSEEYSFDDFAKFMNPPVD